MNAPVSAAALAKPALQLVAIGHLHPSKSHVQELRRGRFTKESLQKLADDIKRNGLLQHPLVRGLPPANSGNYEIVAGERRWLAAKLAGLTEIYVNVRELDDNQALEAQLSENLQREDLHELEEAEGYDELMKLKKVTVDQLVEQGITPSRSYAYARLKLLALCPEGRAAFYAGELDASRALLIARIGHHDTQRQAMKDILKGHGGWEGPMSYREAQKHLLERYMLKLASAPFDIKDAQLLPKAGDCIKCPKRTGNQSDLFGDVKGADVSTDPKCFDDKRQAYFAGDRKKKEAAGHKVIAGAEAKKLLPHWEHNDNGYLQGDYYRLDTTEWIGGRSVKVRDVLGKDYVPALIQHPLSGKFIEVAPKSTVSAKASAKSRDRQERQPRSAAQASPSSAPSKPAAPDIDELVAERVIALLAKKPIRLDVQALRYLAEAESDAWDAVSDYLLKLFKLSTSGRMKLEKLSEKDLGRFVVLGTVDDGLLSGMNTSARFADEVCRRFKIDRKKVRAEILDELKREKEEAAKPKVTASGTPTWSTPAPVNPPRKKGKSDFMRPMQPSDQLAAITGAAPLARTEITKKVWGHVKRNSLQDKKNVRMINVDQKLAGVFGTKKKQVSMFEMMQLVSKHLRPGRAAKAKGKK